ncbi:MAG: DUF3892 domain-containing protein [Burkholderiales bacterium]|nr:DUF3892 domain-containing protein [Burkholderiales bacterium]
MTKGSTFGSRTRGSSWQHLASIASLAVGVLTLAGTLWFTLRGIEFTRLPSLTAEVYGGSLIWTGAVALFCALSLRSSSGRGLVITGLICALIGAGITLLWFHLLSPYNPLEPRPLTQFQIKCINKAERNAPYEHIRSISGFNPTGARWILTQEQAIQGIEAGKWSFYVSVNGATDDILIANSSGNKYLKAKSESEQPARLLSLDECR